MKKRILILALAIVFVFAGCTGNSAPKMDAEVKTEAELQNFEVVLDWYPNAIHTFIYEAIEKGYYAEEGLNVIIRFPANTNDALSLTAAGKADIGMYYMHDLIMAKAEQNIPVKSVGAVVQSPLNIFLSLKEKNIKEPKDLIGKTVGQSGSKLSEATIKMVTEKAGALADSVKIVDVGFDLMSSMTTGNVDATLGAMVNHEVPALEDEGFEVNYFYPTDYGMPNYYELVFVAGDKKIAEAGDKIAAFLRASAKGFEDVKNDPAEAVKLLLANQNAENFPLKEGVETKSIGMLLPTMETENAKFLSQDKAVWEENIKWLEEQGIVKNKVLPEDVYVDLLAS